MDQHPFLPIEHADDAAIGEQEVDQDAGLAALVVGVVGHEVLGGCHGALPVSCVSATYELVQFGADKINLIAELPAITKRAILADTRASERTQPSDSVIAFHTLYSPVSVDGVAGVARLVIRQDVNGKYAYGLQHSDILKSEGTAEAVPSAGTPRIEGWRQSPDDSRPTPGCRQCRGLQGPELVQSADG